MKRVVFLAAVLLTLAAHANEHDRLYRCEKAGVLAASPYVHYPVDAQRVSTSLIMRK